MALIEAPIRSLPAALVLAFRQHMEAIGAPFNGPDDLVGFAAEFPAVFADRVASSVDFAAAAGIVAATGRLDPLPVPGPDASVRVRDVAHAVLVAFQSVTSVNGLGYADVCSVIFADTPRHPLYGYATARGTDRAREVFLRAAVSS